MKEIEMELNTEPVALKAGDDRVLVNGRPFRVDFRVLAEDLYQQLTERSYLITRPRPWEQEREKLHGELVATQTKLKEVTQLRAHALVDLAAERSAIAKELREFCERNDFAYKDGSDWREMLSTVLLCFDGTIEGTDETRRELDFVKSCKVEALQQRDELKKTAAELQNEVEFLRPVKFAAEKEMGVLRAKVSALEEVLQERLKALTGAMNTVETLMAALATANQRLEGNIALPRMESAVLSSGEHFQDSSEYFLGQIHGIVRSHRRTTGEGTLKQKVIIKDADKAVEAIAQVFHRAAKRNEELHKREFRIAHVKGAHGKE